MKHQQRNERELARWKALPPKQKALERIDAALLRLEYLEAVGEI